MTSLVLTVLALLGMRRASRRRAAIRTVRPRPTAITLMRSTREEIQGPKGRPDRPRWITGHARKKWGELTPLLEQMVVLSLIDASALAMFCDLYRRFREARERGFIDFAQPLVRTVE